MVSTFVKPAGTGVFCVLQSQPLCVPEEIEIRQMVSGIYEKVDRESFSPP